MAPVDHTARAALFGGIVASATIALFGVLFALIRVGGVPQGLVATLFLGGAVAVALTLVVGRVLARQRQRRLNALVEAVRQRLRDDPGPAPLANPGDDPDLAAVVGVIDELWLTSSERIRDLRSQADVLRSLLEASPSGILITSSTGRIRYLNSTFEQLVRLRGDPIGRLPIEAVPVVEVQTAVDAALRGEPTRDLACLSDPYELLLQAVPAREGGALVLAQDVTQFRLAERARTDFVANVSHELRTPLTAILGFAETLAEDDLPIASASIVQRIYRNAKRLRDLFEDLLTLSRIEARRGELPVRDQPLRPILAEALAHAADLANDNGQAFELKCKRELHAKVNAEALSTIVSNLVVNACHYTPAGGHIQVKVREDADAVRVAVTDDGMGIDPAHHQRIFERFYRVDAGRSRRKGGTGLGLAIVKHLAVASGARITVESVQGQGSTFTLHIPR